MLRSRHFGVISILLDLMATACATTLISGLQSQQIGLVAVRNGENKRAASALGTAAPRLPWRPELWEMAGLAAYQAGEYEAAVRILATARDREALTATGWEVLGSSLWALGLLESAVTT